MREGYAGAARPRLRQGAEHPGPALAEVTCKVDVYWFRLLPGGNGNIVGFWPYEKRGHPWVNASIPLRMIPVFRRMLRIRWRRNAARPEAITERTWPSRYDAFIPSAPAAAQPATAVPASDKPVMYVKDHCPKCKGAEQRFKLAKVQYSEVNCSENMDIARELGIQQTPTIIDPDGTRYVGDNAAAEWLKAHNA